MNCKERVYATMNFEPIDRPAAFPLEGSQWICRSHGISYGEMYELPDCGAAMLVEGFRELHSDAVFVGGSGWMAWASAFGSHVNASNMGVPVEVGPAFEVNAVPDLTDEEIREKLQGSYYVQTMVKQIREVKKLTGDEYPLMCGHTGPFTAAGVLVGTSKFMRLIGRKKPELPGLLDFATRTMAIYSDILAEAGCDILNICDPIASGDMVSPASYEEFAVPAYAKYNELRKNSLPFLMHICGNSGSRVEAVRNAGAKFYSVDSMVDLEAALKLCEGKMVMVGNINPAAVMLQGTPEEVHAEATRILQLAAAVGQRVVPCTGCELPSASPLENVRMLRKAAEDFAKA